VKTWRDRLVTASYWDQTFLTESHETKLGRKLVVHEYPGSDMPQVEDFGMKAGELHVVAYFIGPNYDEERNIFLLLLQAAGSHPLIHPWLGVMEVRPKDWTVSESNEKGGYCTIAIDFVAVGEVMSFSKLVSVDEVIKQTSALDQLMLDIFAIFKMGSDAVNGYMKIVSTMMDGWRNIIAIARLPLTWVQQITGQIDGINADFDALLAIPGQFEAAVLAVFGSIAGASADVADTDKPRIIALLTDQATRYPINATLLTMSVPTTSALVLPVNIEKHKAMQAVALVSAASQIALINYNDAATRDTVLAEIITAIDILVPQLPDALFQAMLALRVALLTALRDQVLDATQSVELINYMPAVVMAWRFEQDDAVFDAMNAVTHPLFMRGIVYG